MYINKPSVTKIEAADRVNLLRSTSSRYTPFHDSHQKDSCFHVSDIEIKHLITLINQDRF